MTGTMLFVLASGRLNHPPQRNSLLSRSWNSAVDWACPGRSMAGAKEWSSCRRLVGATENGGNDCCPNFGRRDGSCETQIFCSACPPRSSRFKSTGYDL